MDKLELREKINSVLQNKIEKIVVSNPIKKELGIRVDISNKQGYFMVVRYTEKQSFTSNIKEDELPQILLELADNFKQFNFFNNENEFIIKISKNNKIFLNKFKNKSKINTFKGNNRTKNYIFTEGERIEPLIDMGVFTKEAKVVHSMYDKFKQINRFIELIDDFIKNYDKKSINIIDFGCGKSYLTFLVYYYFKFIKNIDITITGLDLKADVIEKCNETAKKYNYTGLKFELGDISEYKPTEPVDMIITLHACDTATDYALFNAIKWGVKMIFSVPCCQHEVNAQIKSNNLPIITRYGVIKERISADFTDIIRCNLLRAMSYNVDLIEFIGFEHTPKNLLIRANLTEIPKNIRENYKKEAEDLMSAFNFNQTLHTLLLQENSFNKNCKKIIKNSKKIAKKCYFS